jgi:hypothetical protein
MRLQNIPEANKDLEVVPEIVPHQSLAGLDKLTNCFDSSSNLTLACKGKLYCALDKLGAHAQLLLQIKRLILRLWAYTLIHRTDCTLSIHFLPPKLGASVCFSCSGALVSSTSSLPPCPPSAFCPAWSAMVLDAKLSFCCTISGSKGNHEKKKRKRKITRARAAAMTWGQTPKLPHSLHFPDCMA